MTKQQGLGEYGKQRFRNILSSIKDENFEKAIEFYRNFNFEIVTYSGNHSIEPEVLNSILDK